MNLSKFAQLLNFFGVVRAEQSVTGGSIFSAGTSVFRSWQSPLAHIRLLKLRKIAWWGDSTTEAASGNGVIPADWASTPFFDALPGVSLHKNFGANGYSTSAILSAASNAVNSYGNSVTPEGVGAAASSAGASLIGVSFGINDLRLDDNVATYGSAAMVAAVQALQSRIVTMISRLRAVAGNIPVQFFVPNTLCLTGALISANIDGQKVTNALRVAYLGDEYIGIPSLKSLVSNSDTCDSGGAVFGVVSPATASKPMHIADELHPNTTGYQLRAMYIAEWLNSVFENEYMTVATGRVQESGAGYTDLAFQTRLATLFGNTSGTSYGALSSPLLGVGDEFVFTVASGTQRRMRITKPPYQNAGESFLRWAGGNGIDGSWHQADLPAGTALSLRRRALASIYEVIAARGGYKIYPVRVTAGSNGSVTVRGIAGTNDLAARAPTTGDSLALASVGGNAWGGLLGIALTGAAITAAAGVGEYTIAKAGTDYRSSVGQVGAIIVPV